MSKDNILKIKGNKISQTFNQKGESVVTVIVDRGWIQNSLSINKIDYPVSIDIKKHHDSKTYQQVKLIWAILKEIDEAYNGISTKDSINELYCNMITQAEIKVDNLYVRNDDAKGMMTILEDTFRVIKPIDKSDHQTLLKCYRGLSQFDKLESSRFIDIMLNYASETIGYETQDIKELKKLRG